MNESPIFILAWGGRTGSTWLQRLLTSTGGVLIWGEQGLFDIWSAGRANTWTAGEPAVAKAHRNSDAADLHAFRGLRERANMAELLPTLPDFDDAWRGLAEALFRDTALREGYPRWGKKETSWDPSHVEWIRRAWREARVIYLYRDFYSVFRSALGTGWYAGRESEILQRWLRFGRQTIERLTSAYWPYERLVSYEGLLRDHDSLIRWCELPPAPRALSVISSTRVELTREQQRFYDSHRATINELEAEAQSLCRQPEYGRRATPTMQRATGREAFICRRAGNVSATDEQPLKPLASHRTGETRRCARRA